MNGGEEGCMLDIGGKYRRKETTRKTKTLLDLTETRWSCMNWIDLAQDRNQWRAFVYAVVNLSVP
jgi:hypothetical protein